MNKESLREIILDSIFRIMIISVMLLLCFVLIRSVFNPKSSESVLNQYHVGDCLIIDNGVIVDVAEVGEYSYKLCYKNNCSIVLPKKLSDRVYQIDCEFVK